MIDETLVRRMLARQFPRWADLPIRRVIRDGWDNRSFRLGDELLVRLPSAGEYAAQVEKEHLWLPRLAPLLPRAVPTPVALGEPSDGFLYAWSVYRWIEGEDAASAHVADLRAFATDVGRFLVALHHIDAAGGPVPGAHNFHRGVALAVYDVQARRAIETLRDVIDSGAAMAVWEAGLASAWQGPPVWVHGDVAAGNLLVRDGELCAVIDFGMLAVGDPACDLSIAWTLFEGDSREAFRELLPFDAGTWNRARAWTLWKAAIVASGVAPTNALEWRQPLRVIEAVLLGSPA